MGELGWEVFVSADMAAHVFETLADAGEDFGLTLVGLHGSLTPDEMVIPVAVC